MMELAMALLYRCGRCVHALQVVVSSYIYNAYITCTCLASSLGRVSAQWLWLIAGFICHVLENLD
jgi:hypothetical protein